MAEVAGSNPAAPTTAQGSIPGTWRRRLRDEDRNMKWLYIPIGILAGATLAFFAAMYAASELGGEVVVLHRPSEQGSTDRVRIWIVEDGAGTWIEYGGRDAEWILRLAQDPAITVERNGALGRYRASPDPGSHALYHRLRRDKYGLASEIVDRLVGKADACPDIPVLLEPARR